MARTMMLLELQQLLDAVPISAGDGTDYFQTIEEDNCLGKRSQWTRVLTRQHHADLYALSPKTTLFRTLRYFWQRDPEGRPLIAALCAYARDPFLRATASFVLNLSEGQIFSREALEEYLEKKCSGRFSKVTLISMAQNLASSWTQAGNLCGKVEQPKIDWAKDRGKDVELAPWNRFFKDNRLNDQHLRLDEKRTARCEAEEKRS
jgi:hypothetical protein